MSRILIFISLFVSSFAFANSEIPKHAIQFSYQHDASPAVACEHQQLRDLPDWTVWCEDKVTKKEFSVHLVLNKSMSRDGRTRFEVLYWVTDRVSPKKREYHGTSMMFNFKGNASGEMIRLGQMVDGGVAHLNLEIKL